MVLLQYSMLVPALPIVLTLDSDDTAGYLFILSLLCIGFALGRVLSASGRSM